MASRTRRSGRRRTTIEVEDAGLRDLASDLSELREQAFERMWRGSLEDVAEDAVTRLADVFEREIEGGPVDHTDRAELQAIERHQQQGGKEDGRGDPAIVDQGIEFEDMTRRYAQDAATATANGMMQ